MAFAFTTESLGVVPIALMMLYDFIFLWALVLETNAQQRRVVIDSGR
jgi:hypothetical protein